MAGKQRVLIKIYTDMEVRRVVRGAAFASYTIVRSFEPRGGSLHFLNC